MKKEQIREGRGEAWKRWRRRLLPAVTACLLVLPMTVQAAGWERQENGSWRYQKEDGSYLVNGYTPDGYYVDGNGLWREKETVLGLEFPMRNHFLSASQAGELTGWGDTLSALLKKVVEGCGTIRAFTLDTQKISYLWVNGDKETELFSFYKDTENDGYILRLKCPLSQGITQPVRTSWYDYQVLRALMHSVSRTGEQLADAVYQSWEDKNLYGLKLGAWTVVGDVFIKYEVTDGAGCYYIKPNPEV